MTKSLLPKIVFIFFITILLFIIVLFAYFNYENSKLHEQIRSNYKKAARHIHQNRLPPNEIKIYLENLNFKVENNMNIIPNSKEVASGPGFDLLNYKKEFYLLIHTPHFKLLAKDMDKYSINYFGFVFLIILFILLMLSFVWIFNATKQISLLLNSRQLFLRTIMHELKTPIAKGKIVSELIDNEKQKQRLISIFDKLNITIDDFSKIEQLVSKNYSVNKSQNSVNMLIQNSLGLLMVENSNDKIEYLQKTDTKIKVDFELFSFALKNLLDNGIKYSHNKKVKIEIHNNSIDIISIGNKLSKPLNEYFQPYHNDVKNKNHGMGLGLYIVHEILNMHKMKLEYSYRENKNIFKIVL